MGKEGMHHGSPMYEIWECLTEEQKKKVAIMKLEMKKKFLQMKIDECQKMAEMKKEIIENINKVEEMIKQGK
jgi:hypothetical protein